MKTVPATGSMNLLTRLSRLVYRRATEDVIGIRLQQFLALDYLNRQGGLSPQQLGRTLMLDANNCVILLNGLEEEGLIERTRDPEDRRRHIVAITPAGQKALEKAERQLETLQDDVLANLSSDERDELRELLAKAMQDHSLAI